MSKAAELANLIGNINAGGGGANKNVIINGNMSCSQRGASFTSVSMVLCKWHKEEQVLLVFQEVLII